MYPNTPIPLALLCVFASIVGVCNGGKSQVAKRQMYGTGGGIPSVEGMGERDASPFVAFWNQGLVPGQGFPQIGMSAYGYGLPGLGLSGFLTPDAVILEGAGHGEINDKDLNNIDDRIYGFDRFKADKHSGGGHGEEGDPAYPGCFANEDCDDNKERRYHHHEHYRGTGSSVLHSQFTLIAAIVAATAVFGC